jgi:polysaccharide export outer membrane protein
MRVYKVKSITVLVAACAVVLAGCETAPPAGAAPPPVAKPQPAGPAAAPAKDEYTLDSGDKLNITVFAEKDLSGPYQVSGQGDISMPLVGEVKAKGLTLRELQRAIENAYRDGQFLRNPQVSAEVVNYRPFYIRGEVKTSGEYPYQAGLTVMNAIARAGDFSYRANRKKVYITPNGSTVAHEVELTPNLMVHPGDTIEIKDRLF